MNNMNNTLIALLKARNIIQKGDFQLKSGEKSDIYVNIKNVISFPSLHQLICSVITEKIKSNKTNVNCICGTPYGAVSFASYISIVEKIPMIFLRKESKTYGTKRQIEGVFSPGQTVILIEDVVTTGQSVIDAANQLERQGLHVVQIIAVFSRCKDLNLKYNDRIPVEHLVHINDI